MQQHNAFIIFIQNLYLFKPLLYQDIDNFGESLPTQHEQYMKVRRRRFEKGNIIIKVVLLALLQGGLKRMFVIFEFYEAFNPLSIVLEVVWLVVV